MTDSNNLVVHEIQNRFGPYDLVSFSDKGQEPSASQAYRERFGAYFDILNFPMNESKATEIARYTAAHGAISNYIRGADRNETGLYRYAETLTAQLLFNYDLQAVAGIGISCHPSLKHSPPLRMGDWEEQENAQAEIVAKLSQHSEATDSYAMDAGSIVIEFRDRKDMLICIVEPGSFQMLWRDKGRFYSCALPGLSFSTAAAIDAVNSHFDR